jgi:quercetin dioxygenase-like cupin family protein
MSTRWTFGLLAGVLGLGVYAGNVLATPQAGVTTTMVARQIHLEPSDIHAHTTPANRWQVGLRTHGDSDAYVVQNTFAPDGTTGWHSHPGPSLVMVTAGEVTNYSHDEPGCSGRTYAAGQSFVDEGGDHVHMLRNEGETQAVTVAVQILPEGADRRIDKPVPEVCESN